jgi:arginyl-tRNA synthetase
MKILDILKEAIQEVLKELGIENAEVTFEHPGEMSHGDFATNVAMRYGKILGKNPREIGEIILAKISGLGGVEKAELAGPGFINIFLSPEIFYEKIKTIDQDYGKNTLHQGKTILVEHSSPNLFKAFHVGHVMNNTVGESIARLAEFSGAKTIKIAYPSDVSLGIGKAVWSLLHKGVDILDALKTTEEKLNFMGQCYVHGTREFEESDKVQKEVREITRKIYAKEKSPEYEAYLRGREINLEYFITETTRLGSKFHEFIFESEAGARGQEIVESYVGKVFEESDGAVVYKGEDRGLHTRVFVNSEGYPTYEAKDIGLLDIKFERFNPDISILITDSQQAAYYKVVLSAASEIKPEWKEKTIHRTHGRMTFKGKKMSSRLGGVPLAGEVLATVGEEVKERLEDKGDDKKVDAIAISALKFSILKAVAGKNIDFDPETSLSFEGDSGPYLQYTIARCNSIIEKAKQEGFASEKDRKEIEDITTLEKLLCRFEETVIQAEMVWEPHHVATYCLLLAREFNSWYGNTKIVDSNNKNMSYNLWLTEAVTVTLTNGLHILGIKALERM